MAGTIKNLLLGRVGENSHPVHPAVIHMPMTFLLAASGLDVLQQVYLWVPALGKPIAALVAGDKNAEVIPLVYNMQQLSYLSTIAYLITVIPAVLSGITEFLALVQAKGPEARESKVAVIHAALNYTAVAGAIYNWLTRRNREGLLLKPSNVIISFALLFSSIYAAYLGGSLVYSHGSGVQRMGAGLKERLAKGEKGVGPETDYAKDLGGIEGEKRALADSTRDTRQKAGQKAEEARQRAEEKGGELRQRGQEGAQYAQDRTRQAAQHAQDRTQGARKEL